VIGRHRIAGLVLVGALVGVGEAAAQCPQGNLLAARQPWAWQDLRGRKELATDGVKAPEGTLWDAPLAVVLDTGVATITWDLGDVYPLAAAWIQADANDSYGLWGSIDGHDFTALGNIQPVEGHGLRGRALGLGGTRVRFLRFGEGEGDDLYSLAEIQVFCQLPTPFPPALPVGNAASAAPARNIFTYWNDETSARWELVLALLGYVLLHWGHVLRRQGRPEAHRRLRDRLLAALGVVAALTFINFGFFHFGNFIHTHEWAHYYLGSKYFPELSYERLYDCISTADVEDGHRRRVERRPTTNLRTNVLESSAGVITHPERCKSHFSAARWQAFRADVAFFRARMDGRHWDAIQVDHGYNATPVWNALGTLLTNLSPAGNTQLYALALLDPLYLLATLAVVWWAFGWRVLSVALLVFATNFPSRFYWTGGSFLRWDWLFYTVASLCCLRRGRPALGGAALAYAAGLRVFPVFLFVGPALALGWHLYRTRRLHPQLGRFFAGAALAGALLLPASLALSGGPAAYRAFAQNTAKHRETPLVNNMGLRMVLSWRPWEAGRHLHDRQVLDPWAPWKEARLRSWKQARPLAVALALGLIALIGAAARRHEPWIAAALGVALVTTAVELTSYYYAFILAPALLVEQREAVGRWLLLLTAFTQLTAWAPLPGMSRWADEQYTLMSAATVAVLAAIVWIFSRQHPTGTTSGPSV
jgi:hypothetical protein